MFSLELPHQGDSNLYTQHTILNIKKQNIFNNPKYKIVCSCESFSLGLKNEFETAVVKEPSVFEPLKLYCSIAVITGSSIYWTHFILYIKGYLVT